MQRSIGIVLALLVGCKSHKEDPAPKPLPPVPEVTGELTQMETAKPVTGFEAQWMWTVGSDKTNTVNDIAANGASIYSAGYFQGTARLGKIELASEKQAGYATKLDKASGQSEWIQTFSASHGSWLTTIDSVGADVIVAGVFGGKMKLQLPEGAKEFAANDRDAFVASLDQNNGTIRWFHHYSGTGVESVDDVGISQAGNISVVGSFEQGLEILRRTADSKGMSDMFVSNFSSKGELRWHHALGGQMDDRMHGVAVDGKGHTVVIGNFVFALEGFGGSLKSHGNADILITKLDAAGNAMWSRVIGGAFDDFAGGVAVDPEGGIIASGAFEDRATLAATTLVATGNSDGLVTKLDPQGKFIWSRSFGSTEKDYAWAVAVNSVGHVAATGWIDGLVVFEGKKISNKGHSDVVALVWDKDGTSKWQFSAGAGDFDQGRSAAWSGDNLVLSGLWREAIDFGKGPVEATKSESPLPVADGFVVRLAPPKSDSEAK